MGSRIPIPGIRDWDFSVLAFLTFRNHVDRYENFNVPKNPTLESPKISGDQGFLFWDIPKTGAKEESLKYFAVEIKNLDLARIECSRDSPTNDDLLDLAKYSSDNIERARDVRLFRLAHSAARRISARFFLYKLYKTHDKIG